MVGACKGVVRADEQGMHPKRQQRGTNVAQDLKKQVAELRSNPPAYASRHQEL